MAQKPKSDDQERDEVLKRMLKTPPKPHKRAIKRKPKPKPSRKTPSQE